jgi:hypothetical protein
MTVMAREMDVAKYAQKPDSYIKASDGFLKEHAQ